MSTNEEAKKCILEGRTFSELAPTLPENIQSLLKQTWKMNKDERVSFKDLAQALEKFAVPQGPNLSSSVNLLVPKSEIGSGLEAYLVV
jgi:hypothetical protein